MKYMEREMIASISEIVEFMEEECSAITVHKAVGKLTKHGEIIRFNVGAGRQRRCIYCIPEIKENLEEVAQ